MGFPTIPNHSPYFTETDVQMLADLQKLDAEGDIRMEYVASLVRAEGQLTDRTVAWQIEALVHNIMVTETSAIMMPAASSSKTSRATSRFSSVWRYTHTVVRCTPESCAWDCVRTM